jgi:hypothetical protein
MMWMNRFRGFQSLVVWLSFMALVGATACSRQIGVPSDDTSSQSEQAPFREVESSPAESSSTFPDQRTHQEGAVPFNDSQAIPAGTLLSVRLKVSISSGTSALFEGTVDEPILVRGKTLIADGTPVMGHVEFVSSPRLKPDRNYVRLVLSSIRVSGSNVPIQTASLFTRHHNPSGPSDPVILLEKGHHLTFRLTQAVYPGTQTAQNTR